MKEKVSKWNSKGGGMSKHRKSGVAHNQAVSRMRTMEYNKEQEKLVEIRKKQKGKMYSSVKEVFKKPSLTSKQYIK